MPRGAQQVRPNHQEMTDRHVFGPVPSRRLGRSLGVDLVPFKTCTYDCVYCQLGRTSRKTDVRRVFVPAEEIIEELARTLERGVAADAITLSGSGEPTLNSEIGEVIRWLRGHTSIPVVVLTNGALLSCDEVRSDIRSADLVIPSLDAATAEVFERVNRPCPSLGVGRVIEGLVALRRDRQQPIWLEIMLVAGLNDSAAELTAIRRALDGIKPDRVQINTVTRPPAETWATPVTEDPLRTAVELLGPAAETIPQTCPSHLVSGGEDLCARILALLHRRPCTVADMAAGLSVHPNEVAKYLPSLLVSRAILTREHAGTIYCVAGGFSAAPGPSAGAGCTCAPGSR